HRIPHPACAAAPRRSVGTHRVGRDLQRAVRDPRGARPPRQRQPARTVRRGRPRPLDRRRPRLPHGEARPRAPLARPRRCAPQQRRAHRPRPRRAPPPGAPRARGAARTDRPAGRSRPPAAAGAAEEDPVNDRPRYDAGMNAVAVPRTIFDESHDDFRDTVRRFVEREVVPNLERWSEAGRVDRDLFRKAAETGLLGITAPEEFGGGGVEDFRYNAIIIEEFAGAGATDVSMSID